MKLLLHGMTQLRNQEAFLAEQIHGKTFDSFADGFTTLAEEIQEAEEELRKILAGLSGILWHHRDPKPGMDRELEHTLGQMEQTALLAACELVQVAYVAGKMSRSVEGWEKHD